MVVSTFALNGTQVYQVSETDGAVDEVALQQHGMFRFQTKWVPRSTFKYQRKFGVGQRGYHYAALEIELCTFWTHL